MELVIDRAYRAFRFMLETIVGYGAAIVMLGATGLAILEIVRRYLFGVVFDWGQDAVTYLMVSAVFLYFAVTQARRSHLAMTAAVDALKSRGYQKTVLALRALVSLISLALFAAVTWWGIDTVQRTGALGRLTQSMILPLWPFQFCLLLGFALMALTTLFQLYQDVQALRGKAVFSWAPVEEGLEI